MPKVGITTGRPGARVAYTDAKTAAALVKGGKFSYVEAGKVSRAKRAIKAEPASRGPQVAEAQEAKAQEAAPQAAPMTAKAVTSAQATARQQVPRKVMTRAELEEMTKADLKSFGAKLGVELLASESKGEFVNKIYRYMRRDMRADK